MKAVMAKMTQVSESPGAPPPQAELVSPNQTWWSWNKANPSKPVRIIIQANLVAMVVTD